MERTDLVEQRLSRLLSYTASMMGRYREALGRGETPGQLRATGGVRIFPRIQVRGRAVLCNGVELDCQKSALSARLFQSFLSDPGRARTREELIEQLYGIRDLAQRSPQYRSSVKQRFIKLVSRTRRLAHGATNPPGRPWIDWFCYDTEEGKWELFRLRNSYLGEIERRLQGLAPGVPSACDAVTAEGDEGDEGDEGAESQQQGTGYSEIHH